MPIEFETIGELNELASRFMRNKLYIIVIKWYTIINLFRINAF